MLKNTKKIKDLEIVSFLHNLADCIEKDELTHKQMKIIGDFFLSYKFDTYVKTNEKCISDNDLMKFVSLGWYIYSISQNYIN